jgi:hypothetical protein
LPAFRKRGIWLEKQICPSWVQGVVIVDGPHFSQKTREMGHPQGFDFPLVKNRRQMWTTRLRGKLTKRRGELGEAAFLAEAASSHFNDLNSRQCAVRRSPAWPAGGARRGREPWARRWPRPAPRLRAGRSC